jgi:hypothetical protein
LFFKESLYDNGVFSENLILISDVAHFPIGDDLVDCLDSPVPAGVLRFGCFVRFYPQGVEVYQAGVELVCANFVLQAHVGQFLSVQLGPLYALLSQ